MAPKIFPSDKIKLIKDIYGRALADINQIRKDRDRKINALVKTIDKRSADRILRDIKGSK
ncbi:MAG: hypothetical protein WC453_03585 [Patescibacteria group bacterium]